MGSCIKQNRVMRSMVGHVGSYKNDAGAMVCLVAANDVAAAKIEVSSSSINSGRIVATT